jgi:hypothetical protein
MSRFKTRPIFPMGIGKEHCQNDPAALANREIAILVFTFAVTGRGR